MGHDTGLNLNRSGPSLPTAPEPSRPKAGGRDPDRAAIPGEDELFRDPFADFAPSGR